MAIPTIPRHIAVALILLASFSSEATADDPVMSLKAAVASEERSEANRARDPYRHPFETLEFLGVKDGMAVVEIWPGGNAWWTEILAPFLKDRGRYYAAESGAETEGAAAARTRLRAKLASNPDRYGRVTIVRFDPDGQDIVPPGTVDMILTFRNLHNWMAAGKAETAIAAFYRALKPGGTLGIEDHRGRTDLPQDPQAKDGYVREDYAIALIERAGFTLVGRSEINANPKDTKDYTAGVWTLPPTYRLKDQDRDRYTAIGESDRFTLKFVKPNP